MTEITTEFLETRIQQLTAGRDQIQAQVNKLQADVNANNGAIQLCQNFLASLAADAAKAEAVEPTEQSEEAKPNGEVAAP